MATKAPDIPDTPVENVAAAVDGVATKADEWKSLPVSEKVRLLQAVLRNANERHQDWVGLACRARGIDATNPKRQGRGLADVEICGPAMFGAYCNGLAKTLQAVDKNGKAPKPRKTRAMGGHHCAVTLYPDGSLLDLFETVGLQGELVLKGNQPQQLSYNDYAVGGVAGILGAGNYDVPTDLLTQMFLKGRVCVYKPNPVAQATTPVIQAIFAPLVEKGYLSFVVGGAPQGSALVQHPKLDEIVMTGSPGTLSKIRPLAGDTPILSELGAVNPWIVVPGKHWNKRSIDGHARSLAWAKLVNNGHVCASPQVVLVAKDWKWRRQFMDRVKHWLSYYGGSAPFYPGSAQTHAHFAGLPNAETLDQAKAFENQQNPVVLTNVGKDDNDPEQNSANLEVLTREAFCPVLAEVPIDAECQDPVAFLAAAVDHAETKLFGSLTAVILMDDKTAKKPKVEEIVAKMKFGVVGINMVPAFGYSLPQLLWGAFPGQTESGDGFLGNSGLYSQPEKAILRAPFTWIGRRLVAVKSPEREALVFRRLATYKLRPNLWTQTRLFSALFLGL